MKLKVVFLHRQFGHPNSRHPVGWEGNASCASGSASLLSKYLPCLALVAVLVSFKL
jgi:hypothetical protein